MIRKIIISMVVAMAALFSLSARAAPPNLDFYRSCYQSLSSAQLRTWRNIANGTSSQCKLVDDYYAGRLSYDQYSEKMEANFLRTLTRLLKIQDTLNNSLQLQNCPYQDVSLDWRGFGEGFFYTNLCVMTEQQPPPPQP